MAQGLCRSDIDADRALVVAASGPAPKRWTIDRLTTLVTMFTLGRVAPDPRQLALWMSETSRLVADLPHDILAHSIDLAVQSGRHGFMPSVGEIRAVANPLAAERSQQLDRLDQMLGAQWLDADRENVHQSDGGFNELNCGGRTRVHADRFKL
ncbi:hypothetical protein [Sphingobium yanoikuyae]|uniref:hypothetical protein n=1 Tax=Sphingobium yanoikuyae TaxID=13690 RepID=UPI00289903F2|nr:hypothetical protein [Sphingobium yanoikuyae]